MNCKKCGQPLVDPSDVINFKNHHTDEWEVWHRQCYADEYNAPHALNR